MSGAGSHMRSAASDGHASRPPRKVLRTLIEQPTVSQRRCRPATGPRRCGKARRRLFEVEPSGRALYHAAASWPAFRIPSLLDAAVHSCWRVGGGGQCRSVCVVEPLVRAKASTTRSNSTRSRPSRTRRAWRLQHPAASSGSAGGPRIRPDRPIPLPRHGFVLIGLG